LTLDLSGLGGLGPDSANSFWNTNHDWTIITATGATNPGSTNFAAITNGTYPDGTFTTITDPNGDTILHFAAVPEPSTIALLIAPFGFLLHRRYGRRKRA
jgi:hypothetical protein